MFIKKGAEPSLLLGSKQGVILVHGFTGSPAEMNPLAKYLHAQGFTVIVPRLPGHGTTVDDLKNLRFQHWLQGIEDAYHLLKNYCKKIAVAGISLGSLLCLRFAADFPIDKLIVMSTPIKIKEKHLPFVAVHTFMDKVVRKSKRSYDLESDFDISYNKYPLSCFGSILELTKLTQLDLPKIQVPALIVQSRSEKTIPIDNAQYIYDRLGCKRKKILWLENSGHMVILDKERAKVFACINDFLLSDKEHSDSQIYIKQGAAI